jgi:hypothetical protein
VTKNGKNVTLVQANNISSFHDLQFNLLGNNLESLFLPSAILIVEGDTDSKYIKKVLQLYLPDRKIAVVIAGGDGKAPDRLYVINESFGDLMKSPYRERILVLLDSRHSVKKGDFTKYGIPAENVIILDQNGIEFYYPDEILSAIFCCSSRPRDVIKIQGNVVVANGIEKGKTQLCDDVISKLTPASSLPVELQEKLISPLKRITGA